MSIAVTNQTCTGVMCEDCMKITVCRYFSMVHDMRNQRYNGGKLPIFDYPFATKMEIKCNEYVSRSQLEVAKAKADAANNEGAKQIGFQYDQE